MPDEGPPYRFGPSDIPPARTALLARALSQTRYVESSARKVGRVLGRSLAQAGTSPRNSAQNKTALPIARTRFLNEAEGARTLNLRIDSPMLYPIELRPRILQKTQYSHQNCCVNRFRNNFSAAFGRFAGGVSPVFGCRPQ